MISYSEALNGAELKLKLSKIKSFHLDSLILLENIVGRNRSYILAHPDEKLSIKEFIKFKKFIKKRTLNKPVAQIIKSKEFFRRNFYVDNKVLIPRPETEEIIIQFNKLVKNKEISSESKVCDLGTGSGIIGITAKLENPRIDVDLVDFYPKSLKVARFNVVNHSTNIKLIRSNLLEDTTRDYDVILANLPYVSLYISINEEAKFEPKEAIYANNDGLHLYSEMFNQISSFKNKPLYLILEFLELSINSMNDLAFRNNYKLVNRTGLVSTYKLMK